ncbi:hypothetical protein CDAR_255991 [Caerostris darwini]|uniref:Uncharacterized protein n=1 Tax=Caerostris darwini TaxID=1538125 RepID=A0AAV4PRY2_9ARAC|nr:hypothetical protein CDAR_255991 [Caerostris darwini]
MPPRSVISQCSRLIKQKDGTTFVYLEGRPLSLGCCSNVIISKPVALKKFFPSKLTNSTTCMFHTEEAICSPAFQCNINGKRTLLQSESKEVISYLCYKG